MHKTLILIDAANTPDDLLEVILHVSKPHDGSAPVVLAFNSWREDKIDYELWLPAFVNEGVEPVYVPRTTGAMEVALTVEVLDLCRKNGFDRVMISSGTGQFGPLVRSLKRLGVRVQGAGIKKFNPDFAKACDFYWDFYELATSPFLTPKDGD